MTEQRPVLRIVSGNPTPEELAALTVALLTRTATAEQQTPATRRVGGWADPATRLRAPLHPGPGAWR